MRMLDQSEAFPKKVNISKYQPLIDSALKASNGKDGLPRVVIEDFPDAKAADKAANAIRSRTQNDIPRLKVSCPVGSKTVSIYRTDEPRRKRKKREPVPVKPETPDTPPAPEAE
jgi:hypothetical protein